MKLYGCTGRSDRVKAAAGWAGVPLEIAPFVMGVDNKTPEFLAKNPFGKVPVLETPDGTCIFESNAIARFLVSSRPCSLYPEDKTTRARIDAWCDACNALDVVGPKWYYPIVGIGAARGADPDDGVVPLGPHDVQGVARVAPGVDPRARRLVLGVQRARPGGDEEARDRVGLEDARAVGGLEHGHLAEGILRQKLGRLVIDAHHERRDFQRHARPAGRRLDAVGAAGAAVQLHALRSDRGEGSGDGSDGAEGGTRRARAREAMARRVQVRIGEPREEAVRARADGENADEIARVPRCVPFRARGGTPGASRRDTDSR